MSPTVRHEPAPADAVLDVVRRRGSTRAVVAYALGLLVIALGITAWLAAEGASFPPPGLLLLLAVPLALCMNRFVFFPNEVGVTADAAVIFAAMVGFRHDALWLGPLLVALLVGPLDAKHWEERAFVRMAYNSGSTAMVTFAALAAFGTLADALGSSWLATRRRGRGRRDPLRVGRVGARRDPGGAARRTHPRRGPPPTSGEHGRGAARALRCGGRSCCGRGRVVADVAHAASGADRPRAAARRDPAPVARPAIGRRSSSALGVAMALGALALVLPLPPPSTLATLLVLSIIVGLESRVNARDPVPVLVAIVVVAAVVVVRGDGRFLAAALVALVVTGMAWSVTTATATWHAAPRAVTGAVIGAMAYSLADRAPGALVAAMVAGVLCLLVTDRRPSTAVWSAPVVAAAATLALLWFEIGLGGTSVFGAGMVLVLVASAGWGSPPWRSRMIGPWSAHHGERARRLTLLATAVAAIVDASVAVVAAPSTRWTWVLVAATLAQADLAMALSAVRQWRFAPRTARPDAAALVSISMLLLALASADCPPPALLVAIACAAFASWRRARGLVGRSLSG